MGGESFGRGSDSHFGHVRSWGLYERVWDACSRVVYVGQMLQLEIECEIECVGPT